MQLVASEQVDLQVRQSAAVNFKNHVKKHWDASQAQGVSDAPVEIADAEKEQIKTAITSLMLQAPHAIQVQLSEALAIISETDFPTNWPTLLPELSSKLASGDYRIIQGALHTANSICKRYRRKMEMNQEEAKELKYVLDTFAIPLTELMTVTTSKVQQTNDVAALKQMLGCVRLMCRIFYSLNYHVLPEVFEDRMNEWFSHFQFYLGYSNPALNESDPEKESCIDGVKSAICENINLYIEKNEEEFEPFLPQFASSVWGLLAGASQAPGQDHLVASAMRFLTTVARSIHHKLFADQQVLKQVIEGIVIPNLQVREEDEELFDMNWVEYVRRDMEGSDSDTRRRMACELVKGLTQHYPAEVTNLCSAYVSAMLEEGARDPARNWKSKDCAIYLVVALTVKGQTAAHGATQTNELVGIVDFFRSSVLPELTSAHLNTLPVLKADSLKFATTFRSQLPLELLLEALPFIIKLLGAESNVVHSYAAICLERMLVMKENGKPRIPPQDVVSHMQPLLTALFQALDLPESAENEYVVKCIMRTLSFAGTNLGGLPGDVVQFSLNKLGARLAEVAKNPRQPTFNHYLFECISAIVRFGSTADSSIVASCENVLFPIFQGILEQDVAEFTPYVFQMLSQLAEVRQPPLPGAYSAIFPALLAPMFWEQPANVPALVRLLQAYLEKSSEEIVQSSKLEGVLGVFQKLIASRSHDHEGFFILNTLVEFLPLSSFSKYLQTIWSLLCQRLMASRTSKYTRSFIVFCCMFVCKHGVDAVAESLESVQAGLFLNILQGVFAQDMEKINGKDEEKVCVVAFTKMLCEWTGLHSAEMASLWTSLLAAAVTLIERPTVQATAEEELEFEEMGYTAAFAPLHNVGKRERDPVPEVSDARAYLAQSLGRLCNSRPGHFLPRIQQMPEQQQRALLAYCTTHGVQVC